MTPSLLTYRISIAPEPNLPGAEITFGSTCPQKCIITQMEIGALLLLLYPQDFESGYPFIETW